MVEIEDEKMIEKIVKAKAREPKKWGDKWQQGILLDDGADGTWYNLYDPLKENVEKQANEIEVGAMYSFEIDDKKMIIKFHKTASPKEILEQNPTKTPGKNEPNTQTQVRREACINSAIAFLGLTPTTPATQEIVIKTAEEFEKWVLR